MKRLFTYIIFSLSLCSVMADEGMWTLYNLPDIVYEQMRQEGLRLTKEALYSPDTLLTKGSLHHAGLSSCVVSFGGFCTGELVSAQGLVLTNHHCGFEAIRSHSTVEHDYMRDGFCADSLGAELPTPGLFVAFMKKQEDVTPVLKSLGLDTLEFFDRAALIDSLEEQMTKQVKSIDSTYYVEINAFFEGNKYYATTYQQYRDIRLVFAPTFSLGKFGGETDNWMWPRQTCDFSVFRIYVDPLTGGPAEYSPKNVPMLPSHWLKVSTNGYKEGDFAMIMGYPGSTERYLSSSGIQEMRDCINDPRQQVRGVKQQVMKRHMQESEAVRIKYDSKYAQSSNYWKNAIGMNKCIDSVGIIRIKEDMERRLAEYLDTTNYWEEIVSSNRGGWQPEVLKRLYQQRRHAVRANTLFRESFGRSSHSELARRATKYFNGMTVEGPDDNIRRQYQRFPDNSDEWDRECDIDITAALMKNYREEIIKGAEKGKETEFLPSFYKTIDEDFDGDYHKYVEAIWNTSILMKKNAKIPLRTTRKMRRDLGIALSMSLIETQADIELIINDMKDSIQEQERLLCDAKIRAEENLPHYSDANSTLRMTFGQVKPYKIGDYNSGYYTTVQSLYDKMMKGGDIKDYYVEPKVREAFDQKTYGIFNDSESKTLNLCFLTTTDITGGNSGSPVMNADGRLIGIAFDGNWDSLSADIHYDSTLARTINVDIRYVLYLMKSYANGNPTRLLEEMGVAE